MGKQIKIDPTAWYTLTDLVNMNAFPFCGTDIRRYRSAVQADEKGSKILKTVHRGEGLGLRYSFLGENVIRFIEAVEAGKVRL